LNTPGPDRKRVAIIGAGPVGCLLGVLLGARGYDVTVFEKRPDLRLQAMSAGRSINLVLTRRGLRALIPFDLRDEVLDLTVPVVGRMMHSLEGELTWTPYGRDTTECNHSISRGELNKLLLSAVESYAVPIRFEHELVDADFEAGLLRFDVAGGDPLEVQTDVIFGCDGGPSRTRELLVQRHGFEHHIDLLEHGYKELTFPAAPHGGYAMAGHTLHIWPRDWHMLMGLANVDGSFTGTFYAPWKGDAGSLETLDTPTAVQAFFQRYYPDAIPLLGDFAHDFLAHPTGTLGTVRCAPWHLRDRVLLVGDAAHGIVPFFGQGLNCGFEDCAVLHELFNTLHDDIPAIFKAFDQRRKPNADAIADMALENFVEMRDKVGDDDFILRKRVEARIEQAMPELYRSRYAMVMYSQIPYRTALLAGHLQDEILERLTRDIDDPALADLNEARRLIEAKLTPFLAAHQVDLGF